MLHSKKVYDRYVQWNLRKKDTAGPLKTVLNSEVSFIQRLP